MNEAKISTCRRCGAKIRWIRTKAGRWMPCDPHPVGCRKNDKSRQIAVSAGGEVIHVEYMPDTSRAADFGFIPHFATCGEEER